MVPADGVLNINPPTFTEVVVGFYHAVDWSEPWIVGLLSMHVFFFLLTIATRRHPNAHITLFLVYLGMSYGGVHLNTWADENWKLFARQDYFDDNGAFVVTMWSMPLLLNALLIVIFTVWTSCQLLKVVGKHKLRERGERLKAAASKSD